MQKFVNPSSGESSPAPGDDEISIVPSAIVDELTLTLAAGTSKVKRSEGQPGCYGAVYKRGELNYPFFENIRIPTPALREAAEKNAVYKSIVADHANRSYLFTELSRRGLGYIPADDEYSRDSNGIAQKSNARSRLAFYVHPDIPHKQLNDLRLDVLEPYSSDTDPYYYGRVESTPREISTRIDVALTTEKYAPLQKIYFDHMDAVRAIGRRR